MNSVAIICEYNPFHTGHAYHITEARKLSGADTVLGIMSGFFVQRAEPALFLPQIRATAAIDFGMDCVIELPVIYSVAAAQRFAEGAISIISKIPSVKYLAIGVEDDGQTIQSLAQIQADPSPAFSATLHKYLECGSAYPAALAEATLGVTSKSTYDLYKAALRKPNNILAIEYLKALKRINSDIQPIFITRQGNGYHDESRCGDFISATAARKMLYEGEYEKLLPYIPNKLLDIAKNESIDFMRIKTNFELLMTFALKTNDLSSAPDCAEGLDFKLSKLAKESSSFDEIINKSVSKRYTAGRLKRIALQSLIGITKEHSKYEGMGRLIALSQKRKDLLQELQSIAKRNSDYATSGKGSEALAAVDDRAAAVYAIITGRSGNLFRSRKPSII